MTFRGRGSGLRIALLSSQDGATSNEQAHAASARFFGRSILECQLEAAYRLGCERIVFYTNDALVADQSTRRRTEALGMEVRTVQQPRMLGDLINADDSLVVFSPGVLPNPDTLARHLQQQCAVLAFADAAKVAEFERIDADRRWAGVLALQGHQLGALSSLPDDVDLSSSLLRIALQNNCPVATLPASLIADGRWHLNPDRHALVEREHDALRNLRRNTSFNAPGRAIAERVGHRLAREILGQPHEAAPLVVSIVCILGAIAAGANGMVTIGFALATLAALAAHIGRVVERLSVAIIVGRHKQLGRLLDLIVIDAVYSALLVIASPPRFGVFSLFPPIMLFGLLRLGERHSNAELRDVFGDRIILGCILFVASLLGLAMEITMLLALAVLVSRFVPIVRAN